MPVECFQVSSFDVRDQGGVLHVTLSTRTRSPWNTCIGEILALVGAVKDRGRIGLDGDYRYEVGNATDDTLRQLLGAHEAPVVTASTDCALSVCLDFHSIPNDDLPTHEWPRTKVGQLIYEAKYRRRSAARQQLSEAAAEYAKRHPVLRQVQAVAAAPGRRLGPASRESLAASVAVEVSHALAIPVVPLSRAVVPEFPQKNLPEEKDPDANQRGPMRAADLSGSVLVVDDMMEDASTVNEAARALRSARASPVFSLCLAKDISGTKGFYFGA